MHLPQVIFFLNEYQLIAWDFIIEGEVSSCNLFVVFIPFIIF